MKPLLTRLSLFCLLWLTAIAGYGQSLTINVGPQVICLGQGIQVTALLSGANQADVTSYVFTFGHPALGNDTFVSNTGLPFIKNYAFHQYTQAGVYKIGITAYFSNRGPISNEVIDTVYNLPISQVVLTSLDSQCYKGNYYCFLNQSLRAPFPSLPLVEQVISYGDGDSSNLTSAATICHKFLKGNTVFQVAMAAADAGGCRTKTFKRVYVAPDLGAKFSLSGVPKCDTTPYIFVNTTPVSPSNLLWFKWYFDDDTHYFSQSPITTADLAYFSGFIHRYTIHGVFSPSLVLKHKYYNCQDSFNYADSKNQLPENIIIKYDIRSRRKVGNDTLADSVCFDNLNLATVSLYNVHPLRGVNTPIELLWDYADPKANPPGSDKRLNQEVPSPYKYQGLGHYFPTLTVRCPGSLPKTINFWSRIDTVQLSDTQYVPPPITNPRINTIHGYLFRPTDAISQYRYIFDNSGSPRDSIVSYWKWFNDDASKVNYLKFRSNLQGFGINIMGPKVQVEDPPVVVMNPFLKNQCGPDFPVEFTNATNIYQSNNLYIKWEFDDDFAPKCTSFSVLNNGTKPYINGTDLLARSTGRYITGGVIYPGRVNCNFNHDTLPIHSYMNWNRLLLWFKNGHDFPPYDSSANGWTKNPTLVTWPNGSGGPYPYGKKLVQAIDTAEWGKPLYSAGPTPSRIDTFINMWPSDISPDSAIKITKDIPDPFAIARGYSRGVIQQNHTIDTSGFISPNNLSNLSDGSTRRYRGNRLLPNSGTTLYDYFFKRGITRIYTAKLTVKDSFNNQSEDPYKTFTRINMIGGNIVIQQKTDTPMGSVGHAVIHRSETFSLTSTPPSIVNDTLIYNYKPYKVYTDISNSQKYILIRDDEFFVDYYDCGKQATIELPLVGVDAYGLGYEGTICPGLKKETGADPTLHFDAFGAPGLYPLSKSRTYLLVNFDSTLDRHDKTPCELDGFVDWQGKSPMTLQDTTPGGNRFPAFNKGPNFSGNTAWLSITDANVDVVHYQPQGPWDYTNMPYARNGYVTIGIIIGNGHAFPGSSLPGCVSDTVWYHNFWHFVVLNGSFTYRKVGGLSLYNSTTITGSPSVLPSEDFTYDTTRTSPTYFEPWSRLFGKGDILEFETQIRRQDFVYTDLWYWQDGSYTVDTFYSNENDTLVALNPATPTVLTFFNKHTFPTDRIRTEVSVTGATFAITRQYRPFPVGVHVLNTVNIDTIWQCNDLTHQLPPQSITIEPIRIDSAFFIHPIRHQFFKSSWENEFQYTQQRIGNIQGQPIQHTITTYDTCSFSTFRFLVIGVIDTFTIKNNDNVLCVGEVGEFTDSIRYWYPKSNGAVNPSRPLSPGEEEVVDVDLHGIDMNGYPIDTIKTFANATKGGKIDTAFFARIYWDYESDGIIDYAGKNGTHKFATPGRFKVSMITRDTVGYWDTCSMFVDVVEPHANFTSKSVFSCSDPTFFNDSSYVKDDCYIRTGFACDNIIERKWWFGDIGYGPYAWRSTVKNPLYPYRKNGWFTLQETILTEQGCVDTIRKSIYISGPRPRIKLLDDTIGCVPYKVRFLSYPNDSGILAATGATFFQFGRPDQQWDIISKNNPDTVTVIYDKEGKYTVTATGYDKYPGNLCKGIVLPDTVDGHEQLINIYVQNPYKVKVTASKQEVCVGEIFKVMNRSNLDTITKFRLYTYNSDTAIIDTLFKTNFPADSSFQYVFNKAGSYNLVLHSTRFKLGSPECDAKDTIKVVARKAKADLKIDSLGLPRFYISNQSDSANASGYIWTIYNPDGQIRTQIIVPNNSDPFYNYGPLDLKNDTGEFRVCITVTTNSLQNCNDSVCKTIINNFQVDINIPNVFTPNGDGINDEFFIKIRGEELYDLKIWNRWGGEVFESTDAKKMWNGHTQNTGAENPEGTYYFIFKYKLRGRPEQIVRGTITLLRN